MIIFGKPYPIYSRIWPPFCFNIPNHDIQVTQILHPEKNTAKGDPLNRPALSRSYEGTSWRWEVIGFHSCLYPSTSCFFNIYFYFTVKTAEDHCCLPNKKLALFLLQGYEPVIKESILPSYKPHLKRKSKYH